MESIFLKNKPFAKNSNSLCYSGRKHYFCQCKPSKTMWSHTLLFGISGGEILILLLLILLLFGPRKIPEIARMVGRGMNEVRKVQREINSEIQRYSSEVENQLDTTDGADAVKKEVPDNQDQTSGSDEADKGVDESEHDNDIPYPYRSSGKDPD